VYDRLHAAEWLRAAGAEWPASFLYQGPCVWSLRTMQWARANGCPWGIWDHELCAHVCLIAELRKQQATLNAIPWAHSAGGPCSSWRHRFAARLVGRSSSIGSSSSSSGSSSSGSSSGDDSVSRWNAELLRLFFSEAWRLGLSCTCCSGMDENC
jgi:hypothetical protein